MTAPDIAERMDAGVSTTVDSGQVLLERGVAAQGLLDGRHAFDGQ